MKALVFAAGLGTRLRPLTDSIPKALVSVGGVPMLERVILKLKACGIDAFVVNTCHFAGKIEEFLASRQDFGVHIDLSFEPGGPYETGGGIKFARRLLGDDRFLAHNVDMLGGSDLAPLFSADDPSSLATLLVTDAEAGRYLLFDDDMCLAGWTDVRTGEVRSPYPDFDAASCRRLAFCGIHIISPEVFPLMEAWPQKFSITDFYLSVAASCRIRAAYVPGLKIVDIGSPESLARAGRMLAAGEI